MIVAGISWVSAALQPSLRVGLGVYPFMHGITISSVSTKALKRETLSQDEFLALVVTELPVAEW